MIYFNKSSFVKSAAERKDFPADSKRHIVFAGRSNVGKSSTINAIVGKHNFARVSSKPGKTVYVNFFDVDGAFWLADLPGYGYAKTSETEKRRFSALINDYFDSESQKIAKLFIIVDIRHEPTSDDIIMLDFARRMGIKTSVIANKADKIKKTEIAGKLEIVSSTLRLDKKEPLFFFSAEKPLNKDKIVNDIIKALNN